MMKNTKKSKRTVLSSMEEIVNQAKIHGLDPEFYQNAENSLDFVSRKLSVALLYVSELSVALRSPIKTAGREPNSAILSRITLIPLILASSLIWSR